MVGHLTVIREVANRAAVVIRMAFLDESVRHHIIGIQQLAATLGAHDREPPARRLPQPLGLR